MDGKIYLAHGGGATESTLALLRRADIAARIPPGADVALKPNLCVAKPAESGATTHAGVLEGVLTYLSDCGIRDVSIIEGSWLGDSTERAFRAAGYERVARRFGVKLYDLKRDSARAVDTRAGKIQICERALNAGYLINLPVLKGHCQTAITCALKNLKGCIPDAEKRRFHTMGLHRPIAALAAALMPALTIVDSICGDLDFEEGGSPVQTDRMLLGEDMVKLDAFGCALLGIDSGDVRYISLAEEYGAGTAALGDGKLIELGDPRRAPRPAAPRGTVARLTRGVEQRDACSACFGNLARALHQLDERGLLGRMPRIAIGQGMRGVHFDGVGIGRCCDGARARVPGCPPKPDEILDVLLQHAGR